MEIINDAAKNIADRLAWHTAGRVRQELPKNLPMAKIFLKFTDWVRVDCLMNVIFCAR